MPDNKTLQILGHEVSVPQPYAEGHTLSAIESKQLNQTFAENIANNRRSAFKKVNDGEASLDEVMAEFQEYARNYQFTEASAGGSRQTLSPIDREARKLATAYISKKLKEQGRKVGEVRTSNPDAYEAEVARIASTDQVQKLAAKNVREQEKLADSLSGLEESEANPAEAA